MNTANLFHSSENIVSTNNEAESSSTSPYVPSTPAHRQFLPYQGDEDYASLKGQSDDDDFFYDSNSSWAAVGTEKVSSVKKRGGGSWLMGFARIRPSEEESDNNYSSPPGLVRSTSNGSLESYESHQSNEGRRSSESSSSSKKGVTFNEAVRVLPIPHSASYTALQRKKMYSTSQEVRANKIRNKKEYRFDGYDWRHATEEWEMSVCMVTGELVHPAHTHSV